MSYAIWTDERPMARPGCTAGRLWTVEPYHVLPRAVETRSAPRAIEAPRPRLADLKAMAAEHGYEVIRKREAGAED